MDSSDLPMDGAQSSRRELHGPRPAPLKVRKDSYKIKKPPVAPPAPQPNAPLPQHRQPIIIYTVSPKVIHTTPGDFMSVVQRLTGPAAASSAIAPSAAPSTVLSPRVGAAGEVFSPAARLAVFEKSTAQTAHPASGERLILKSEQSSVADDLGIDGGMSALDRPLAGFFHCILSPLPSSLPWISPNLFTSTTGQNQINFFNELSPAPIHGNKSFLEMSSFLPSPNNFLSSGIVPSPAAYWDLFNQSP